MNTKCPDCTSKQNCDACQAILLEALRCVAGAEEVTQNILSLVRFAFDHRTYRISARVKTVESLYNKALRKNNKDLSGKENAIEEYYAPTNSRDIIGIRIVTLLRSEIPESLSRLFRLFTEYDIDQIFRFDEIEEVINYYSIIDKEKMINQIDDIIRTEEHKQHFEYRSNPKDSGSGYTSVHIVIWCTYLSRDSSVPERRYPIEFQIRSAMEDAWSEIEHKINYKIDSRASEKGEVEQHFRDQIPDSKVQLDSASKTLENIIAGLEMTNTRINVPPFDNNFEPRRLEEIVRQTSARIRNLERSTADGSEPTSALELKDAYDTGVKQRGSKRSERPDRSSYRTLISKLSSSTEAFNSCISILNYYKSKLENNVYNYLMYNFRMEIAYNEYKSGDMIRRFEGNASANNYIQNALSIYRKLSSRDDHTIVSFRMGQCFYSMDKLDLAFEHFDYANNLLANDSNIEAGENEWIHLRAPMSRGLTLWAIAQDDKRTGKLAHKLDYKLVERIEHLRDAAESTRPAAAMDLAAFDVDEPQMDELRTIQALAINNYLYYRVSAYVQASMYKESGSTSPDVLKKLGDVLDEIPLEEHEITSSLEKIKGMTVEGIRANSKDSRADTVAQSLAFLMATSDSFEKYRAPLYAATFRLVELALNMTSEPSPEKPGSDEIRNKNREVLERYRNMNGIGESYNEENHAALSDIASSLQALYPGEDPLDMMLDTIPYALKSLTRR
ncbi:RelA/SpoT family protein [Maricaulis maris]|uniref:RelA/SpoT family protein n=1 Tax=Maricaulis maris TaxID=74318 RepID=A0A495CVU9_9PROT|nr:RelA/SpoT family protein [Maricaulis maris]